MDRTDGNENANFSYEVRFNIFSGNIEFLAHGSLGAITNTLIARPYLDRWYHVAVVRQQSSFTAYVDGRQLNTFPAFDIGNAVGGGLAIGGVSGNSRLFLGDVVEVAIYQAFLSTSQIQDRMFKDQRTFANLKGYYKLAYSTNAADFYRNYVSSPTSGTDPATKQGAGNIGFEETDQAGEQSLFDSRKNRGQDSITPLSGAFSWSQTAFARPVPGIAFDFQFGYSSATPITAPADGSADPFDPRVLGKGWRQTFDTRIVPEQITTERRLLLWDGSIETWNRTNSIYFTRHKEYRGEFVQLPDFSFEWTTPERLVYHFQDPTDGSLMAGHLREIRDFNGNKVQIQWNEDEGFITNIVDTAGGNYAFNYNTVLGLLTNVTFGQWQVNFGYDATNRLISKTVTNISSIYAAIGTTWQFQYGSNGLLARIVDPRGNTNTLVQYDQYGRQTNQVDALGRATATRYGVPGNRQITRIDSGTNSWLETYDRKGHILAQQDPLANITSYTYNTNGNRISITEPLGWQTTFAYDTRANVIARTNALGEVTRWTIHSFFNKAVNDIDPSGWTNFYTLDNNTGNLLNQYDAIGTLVSYTYRTNGLVDTSTDANGRLTRFDYNTNGFLISKIDPGTNTRNYTCNDVGWKMSETDPLGEVSTYSYNLNGNIIQAIDPLFRHFTKTYDASGNLLSESDGKGQLTTYAYDAANQRTNMVDRTGTNKWTYTYTLRGKLASAIDPQANIVTQTYDAANRLVSATDPLGNSVTNLFDANGNQIVLLDKIGQRWTKTFDRLNRVIAESDPQGDTRQTSYDQVGRIKVVMTPNGYPSTHTYDGRGRLIKWVDAENFQWLYAYDGNANITNITDALNGHYVMTYGPRNERLAELNQDTNQWSYAYDELLRLKQQTDPNGTTRSPDYDAGGRLLSVQFNTGRRNTLTYDDNNNPRTITRRVGTVSTTTQFNYDVLDRVTEETDTFQQTVRYGYDSLSRVSSLTYPDGKVLTQKFDPLGRLTNQVDWAARQMNYSYDKVGRLLTRTYPNGITQTNSFDNAGRITALSYAPSTINSNSINLALTYAYDRNGNKTGGGESGTFTWPLPSLIDETSHFTPAGRITSRVDALNATNNFTYQFDKSGNMTNASGGGQSWTLTYDEDNRTTSIHWQVMPLTDKLVTNRYDALGRRVSRTLDSIETRYVLDLQGSMERILCDTDAGGNITAWYVHGPDLCYKVNATNGLTCYHADAQANIIALTDGNTNLMAQYAYTPYGRSLGSTNFQSQISNPYLFVGSQGVMEELPGLYFMRARYYSADAGVFLSTDPVRKIGAGWKPTAYNYANDNPSRKYDPNGNTVLIIAGAGGVQAGGGLAGQAQLIIGTAIDVKTGDSVGISCTSAGGGVGVSAGAGVSADIEFYPKLSLDEIAGTFAYAGADLGAGVRGSADMVMDESGHPIGVSAQIGLFGGGGATIHGGIGRCAIIPGTAGNIFNPFIGPDHSLDANGGTVAGSTPMMAGMRTQPSQQSIPSFQLNANVGGTGKPASSMVSGATVANGHATSANQIQVTQTAPPSNIAGTTPMVSSSVSTGGGSRSGSTATSTQATSSSSTSFLSQVGSVISNVATSIGNFFSGFFR
jgi:RHS repeat-associated protein